MTLSAFCWEPVIEDGVADRARDVRAAWPVTPFAAYIPLGDSFGGDVVIHRVEPF